MVGWKFPKEPLIFDLLMWGLGKIKVHLVWKAQIDHMLDFSSIYSLGELEYLLLHGKDRKFSWKSEVLSGQTNIIAFFVCFWYVLFVFCCSCINWLWVKGHLSTITSGVNCFQGIITGVVMIWHVGNSGGHFFSVTRNDCGTPAANCATTFVSSTIVQPSLGSLIYIVHAWHFAYFRLLLWLRRIKHCFDWSLRKLPFCFVTCRQSLISYQTKVIYSWPWALSIWHPIILSFWIWIKSTGAF